MIEKTAMRVFASACLILASGAFGQSAWKSQDIGATAPGSTSVNGSTITVQGNGADIYGTADAFRFVYLLADGDCQIQARVVSQQNTHEWAKAGVMIRQSLDAGSQHVHINRNPGVTHGIEYQYRTALNGSTSGNYAANVNALPRWLRLERTGNGFRGYYAPDVGGRPGSWVQQGTVVPVTMSNPVYVGLSCLSHVQGTLSTVVFDNVQTTGTRKVGAGFIIGEVRPRRLSTPRTSSLSRLWASLLGPNRILSTLLPQKAALSKPFAVRFD